MTLKPQDLTIRPISGLNELDLFSRLPYLLDDELEADLAAGRRRPEWMWIALRGDRILARLAWWGKGSDGPPVYLDILDLDDAASDPDLLDVGVRLVKAASDEVIPAGTPPPEYLRFVPADWRDGADTRRVVEDRMTILERTGARLFVERLRLEWRPGTPIPEPSGRLAFRPVRDPDDLLALMTPVMDGTLDAHSRQDLTRMSARDAAVQHYEGELALYASPREWWRIATLPGGDPVGFVIPARNDYSPIIAYLGVVPARRGQRLHRRHPRRGHPHSGRTGRPAHRGVDGPRKRTDGKRVPARRLRQLRTLDQHDLVVTGPAASSRRRAGRQRASRPRRAAAVPMPTPAARTKTPKSSSRLDGVPISSPRSASTS